MNVKEKAQKEKILLITKKCTCGEEERKFFTMTSITVDHPLVCSTFMSKPLTADTTVDTTELVQRQTVTVDACSQCINGRDVFAEREQRKLVSEDIDEFTREREEWEYVL